MKCRLPLLILLCAVVNLLTASPIQFQNPNQFVDGRTNTSFNHGNTGVKTNVLYQIVNLYRTNYLTFTNIFFTTNIVTVIQTNTVTVTNVVTVVTNSSIFTLTSAQSVDWSQVGVDGGIPTVSTVYTNLSTIDNTGTTDVSANINFALSVCPSNQVVILTNGTFLISNTLNMAQGVVLRGQGTNTVIKGNFNGTMVQWYGSLYFYTQTNLLSGYTKGSSNITLAAPPAASTLAVGTKIMITESNDTSQLIQCGLGNACVGQMVAGQWVAVQAISNTTNLTIWPPLFMTYSNILSPIAYWNVNQGSLPQNDIEMSGIENLVVSNANAGGSEQNFFIQFASRCWIKNVNSYYAHVAHILSSDTYRCEYRDSLFYGVTPPIASSQCYGIQFGQSENQDYTGIPKPSNKTSSCLVENNRFAQCRGSLVVGYGTSGSVFGYNYFQSETNDPAPYSGAMRGDVFIHSAQPVMNLFEGNIGGNFTADFEHGSSAYSTLFRNYWRGRDLVNFWTNSLRSVEFDAFSWNNNAIGNVLGYPGVFNDMASLGGNVLEYAKVPDTSWSFNNWYKAWMFGYDGEGGGITQNDPQAFRTANFTGNFDYIANNTVWANGNAYTLTNSLYKSSKPSWWGAGAWPSIGPDLTPMVGAIPAQSR